MQFALVNEERCEATPGAQGRCPQCRGTVLAKCGPLVVHHWAHVAIADCDPWWEPETAWHRWWKTYAFRTEVTIASHRADIVTSRGLIVELQHSTISAEEIAAREACYGHALRWFFDGTTLPIGALHFRHRATSREGWEIVTFRWKHPRKSYGLTTRPTYIDLTWHAYVLKLGALHLEDGPPYGGWGTLVPKQQFRRWLK